VSADSRLATAFASAEDSIGLLLWQVTNRWQAAQRAALKPTSVSRPQPGRRNGHETTPHAC
jgi:hypothetical protein